MSLEEIRKQTKVRILRSGISVQEEEIFCPYCAEENSDKPYLSMNEENEIKCEKCSRHFMVKPTLRFSTRRLK